MKTREQLINEAKQFISDLEDEANACAEIGSNFSAEEMRDEAERIRELLSKGIVSIKQS